MRRLLWALLVSVVIGLAVYAYARTNPGVDASPQHGVALQPGATPSIPEPTSAPTITLTPSLTPEPTKPPPPPGLLASYPIDGDLAVRPTLPMTLVFDRPVDPASLEAAWSMVPPVDGIFSWPSETTVSFSPTEAWAKGEYALRLEAGLCGSEGGCTNQDISLDFAVGGRGVPVPVLMYHRVRELEPDATETQRTWTVSPSALAEQMDYLVAQGYRTISPNELADYLETGYPLPLRPVIITFDDGSIDVYTTVYPLLKDGPLRPVLFLIPSHMVGYGAYLDWAMARELVAAGFVIGVHSYDHISLRGLPDEELSIQVKEAKTALEEGLSIPLDSFSYPMGAYDDGVLDALARYGYRTAFTINPSLYHSPDEPYLLSRLRVSYDMTLEEFADLLPW